ncbi:MAG: PIN domain-containing protein [Gaiellaceae bacterium]
MCQRAHGLSAADVRSALEPVLLSNAFGLAVSDETEAWLATELRAKHYHRKQRPLSMADCFLLAHAIAANDDLATSDPDVAVIARAEGVAVIPLPDRSGARP